MPLFSNYFKSMVIYILKNKYVFHIRMCAASIAMAVSVYVRGNQQSWL